MKPESSDGLIFLEVDASNLVPRRLEGAELERYLERMKKHAPGKYAFYMEQQELRKKQSKPPEDTKS